MLFRRMWQPLENWWGVGKWLRSGPPSRNMENLFANWNVKMGVITEPGPLKVIWSGLWLHPYALSTYSWPEMHLLLLVQGKIDIWPTESYHKKQLPCLRAYNYRHRQAIVISWISRFGDRDELCSAPLRLCEWNDTLWRDIFLPFGWV